jgi:DNA ligase (NAD+)
VAAIEGAGHVFKSGVSKGLDYLVIADPASTSSKAVKARKLGTVCIGEAELMEILGKS